MVFPVIISIFWIILIVSMYYTLNMSHLIYILGFSEKILINPWAIAENIFLFLSHIIFVVSLIGIYIASKKFFYNKKINPKTYYYPLAIFGVFLGILFVVSGIFTFFSASYNGFFNILRLFFHICLFLFYPFFFIVLWKNLWATLLRFFDYWKNFNLLTRLPVEIALGMSIFSLILFFLASVGLYTATSIIITIIFLTSISFVEWKNFFHKIFTKITLPHSPSSSYVLSIEIPILLFFFLLSASLIQALRPFPVGWDDLGVYMNFPRILAQTGTLMSWAGMYAWNLITGIPFLFEHTSWAFFVNQLGGILSTLAITSFLFLLIENREKKSILCLPVILWVIYYLLPMTVFQQAKDMKVDPMLMFVSISALISLFLGIKHFFQEKNKKPLYILLSIAGFLSGIAFSIKATTLIFLISIFVFLSYFSLGILGFIGSFFLFIAIFTNFWLWAMMFVWLPENSAFITIISGIIAVISYIFAGRNFIKFREYIVVCAVFFFSALLPLSVWFWYNITTSLPNVSMHSLFYGNGNNQENGIFKPDYNRIYTNEEITEKEKNLANFSNITNDGKSLNEDFSRYFWQETGLNNYIKLPFNLTFQINQKQEFTDITFIFLAFFPVTLLFWKTQKNREKIYFLGISIFLLLGILTSIHIFAKFFPGIFWLQNFSQNLTDIFSRIELPWAYGILIWLIWTFFVLIFTCLENNSHEAKIKTGILVFTGIYGFLFWISAFGIVWYGVVLYALLLSIIAIWLQEHNENHVPKWQKIFLAFCMVILGIYMFGSATRHALVNLKNEWFAEYKFQDFSENISAFVYRNFFHTIYALNIGNKEVFENKLHAFIKTNIPNLDIQKFSLKEIHAFFLTQLRKNYERKTDEQRKNYQISEEILNYLYKNILSPEKNFANNEKIYRIGTFFTYFIHNNRSRYLDDSLIQNFETYFYDKNNDITIERMQKVGIKYFLIDLNAATIDHDPRKYLTHRYEHLLETMLSKKLTLIDTDNLCLRFALDEYHKDNINKETFMLLAGTNYDWVNGEKSPYRNQKLTLCMEKILSHYKEKKENSYEYLLSFYAEMMQYNEQTLQQLFTKRFENSYFVLFELTKNPTE